MNTKNKEKKEDICGFLREELFRSQDKAYGDFLSGLLPGIPRESVIGVRAPAVKKLAAASQAYDVTEFLDRLPHEYHEENDLHASIVSRIKDYDEAMRRTELFLPYIDNWATCDCFAPKIFAKHKTELLEKIKEWKGSERTYTVRFAIGALMRWFSDSGFEPDYPELVCSVSSEEYYINMMRAWYFATLLAKQYDCAVKFIEDKRLDVWTHNKAIRKAIESFRVTDEHKAYLRTLVIKSKKPEK